MGENNASLELITGKQFTDQRGTLTHFNDLDLSSVKRIYTIQHPETTTVRAWLAHKLEIKFFFVLQGEFEIVLIKPDDWQNPSKDLSYVQYKLQANDNQVLIVPGGHAFGFKATVADSKLMVFSNFTSEDSANDDYRFDKTLWYNWN